jgi:hypothetical protein
MTFVRRVPKTPGWKIKLRRLLTGDEKDMMYPRSNDRRRTTKLSITCMKLSM